MYRHLMKTAGLMLPLLLALGVTAMGQSNPAAATRADESQSKLSPEVSQQLTDKLPKYSPPAPEKPAATKTDPDVLELPKVTITQKKRPRLNDQVMMTNKAFNDKLARQQLSSFDRSVLNKFTLPSWFGGVSAAERAREDYDRAQREQLFSDVARMAKVIETEDPAQAKVLRDALAKP